MENASHADRGDRIVPARRQLSELERAADYAALEGRQAWLDALGVLDARRPELEALELEQLEALEDVERPHPVTPADVELVLSLALAWQAEGSTAWARILRALAERIDLGLFDVGRALRFTRRDVYHLDRSAIGARCLDVDTRVSAWALARRIQAAAQLEARAPRYEVTELGRVALERTEGGLVHRPDTAPGGGSRGMLANASPSSGDATHRATVHPLPYGAELAARRAAGEAGR